MLQCHVERGKQLGRQLGFPTANLVPDAPVALPRNGVYAAAFWIDGEALAHPCMLNQGVHPTVPEGKPTIEAHLLDYRGDLYGRPVHVEYLRFLRPERRFDTLDALIDQLARDRQAASNWLDAALAGRDDSPEALRARAIAWTNPPDTPAGDGH